MSLFRFTRWLGLALLVCMPVLVSAELAAGPIAIRDDRGHEHSFAKAPARIVTLLPSLTESICALGACALLVGVDRYSNWPESVKKLPQLGGMDDAPIERIVALKPDVVLAAGSSRITGRLEALGLTVVLIETRNHAEVRRSLNLVAKLLGTPEAGERAWAQIEQEIATAAARVPQPLRGQKVYFEVASDPYAAGSVSFIGETLALLGMGNVVPPELGPFPKLNPEYVIRAQPDVIVGSERAVREMPGRPGWRVLKALPAKACGFSSARYDVLVRPGPRMGEAAGLLAECLAGLKP